MACRAVMKRNGEKEMHAYVAAVRKQSAKQTGVVCPTCRQRAAMIDDNNPLMFRCPACGNMWRAEEPKKR